MLGGVGYCREFPVEQYARDLKIVSIWEGTNYIQSLDLVGRKLGIGGGKVFQDWMQGVFGFTEKYKEDPDFAPDFKLLFKAAQATGDFTMRYMKYLQSRQSRVDRTERHPVSGQLRRSPHGAAHARTGIDRPRKTRRNSTPTPRTAFSIGVKYRQRKFFCRNILPNVFARHMALLQEDTSALEIPEEAFLG